MTNNHSEDFIPIDKRTWNDIPAYGDVKGKTLECRISKQVTRLVRHRDFANRENDGTVHWKSVVQSCDTPSLILIGLIFSGKEASKLDFTIAATPTTFQGIPGWEEFLYHRGSSFNVNAILQAGLIAGGKDKKKGRQTTFFTPLDPFGEEAEEEFNDLSRPRNVHYYSKWKPHQGAVCWILLARAQ